MRNAIASSPPGQTICSDSGNPDVVNPLGTASPHRSRKLTQRVKNAGVVLWSTVAIGMAGVIVTGDSSASTCAVSRGELQLQLLAFGQHLEVFA